MNVRMEDVLGYAVRHDGVPGCVDDVVDWIRRGRGCRWLACLNPHSYVVALDDAAFAAALHDAEWLVPDGQGIVLASRVLDGAIRGRVTGSDIFLGVLRRLNESRGFSVFFLGATEETLALIRSRMARDFPNVQLAGTYSPPFKPAYSQAELEAMLDAINAAAPDVLWVGMTAPKQEKWLYAHRNRLNVKFAAAIGAVFDFYTGRVKRSHPVFQKLGLEWGPRFLQEPSRLWRRNFVSTPLFLMHLLKARLTRSSGRKQSE